MEYEEYLREVVKDKDHRDHIHADIALRYFPFTTRCPKDGKSCQKERCGEYRDTQCLLHEMHLIMYDAFGTGDNYEHFNIELEDQDSYLHWRISYSGYYPAKVGGQQRVGFSLGTDNYGINMKVIEEVGLGKYLAKDGDSTYSSNILFPQTFEGLPKVREFLELIKEKKEEIDRLFVKYHTCVRCHKVKSYDINFYAPVGICDKCVGEITEDWLRDNGFEMETN